MMYFTVETSGFSGLESISRQLKALPLMLRGWVNDDLAKIMQSSFIKTFNQGQSGGWQGLADSTQVNREWLAQKYGLAIGPSTPILKRFGMLKDAVVNMNPVQTNLGNSLDVAWGLESIKKSGNENDRAAYGGTLLEKYIYNQPKRPMVNFRNEDEMKIANSLDRFMQLTLNRYLQ